MPALPQMRLVLVEWLDSGGCSPSWSALDGGVLPCPLVCLSAGWLLYDGDDCKVVVPHYIAGDGQTVKQQGCGDMTIPTRAIVRIVDMVVPNFGSATAAGPAGAYRVGKDGRPKAGQGPSALLGGARQYDDDDPAHPNNFRTTGQ